MKKVTKETVKHISELIRIFIPDSEIDQYLGNLKTSLTPTEVFAELDTQNVEITSQTINTRNIMREDEAKPSLSQEEALSNAKDTKDGYFSVKKVI